jgi:hypothetical protein
MNAPLHLRVRVEHHSPGVLLDEADRPPQLQLAALGLVEEAAAQPCARTCSSASDVVPLRPRSRRSLKCVGS